jgi:hypothetical protein
MAGLVPAISLRRALSLLIGIAGSSPAMTVGRDRAAAGRLRA